jgi:hypothetical protein
MNVHSKSASVFDELIDEIRIEEGERTRATMEDDDLRAGTRRDMRELEGDVPASDTENPPRELVQLQKLIARRDVIGAGYFQTRRGLSGGNHDVPSLQCLVPYLYCRGTGEARPAMERRDAGLRESVLAPRGNRIGERTLETHQLGPIDSQLLGLNA